MAFPASVVSSIHSNVHKGVMTNNYDKHLREMSPWQARIFECIAGDVLADHGYRLRHPSSLPAAWLIRLLLDAPLRWLNTWRYARREKRILNVATSQAMQGRQP
jgi:hypothetical protein